PTMNKLTLFSPKAGATYTVVVGARDSLTTGAYSLRANVGWQYASKPDISIGNITLNKSDMADTKTVYFPVTLSHIWNKPVTVSYSPNTTCAGVKMTSGKLTFQPGQTYLRIPVQITSKPPGKADLLFSMKLSMAVNGTILKDLGHGTIVNDERDEGPYGWKFDDSNQKGQPAPHVSGTALLGRLFAALQGTT